MSKQSKKATYSVKLNATPTITKNATPTASPYENMDNLKRKCLLTIGNISKMANRLERRNNWFQFFLIYYSIVGIIDALIPKYFSLTTALPMYVNSIFEFWDVLIAIVLLIFSSQVALFKYLERIKSCVNKLNQLKAYSNNIGFNNQEYDKYNAIMADIDFLFNRTDFYYSCVEFDKKSSSSRIFFFPKKTSETSKHFTKFEILFILLKKWLENTFYFTLTILPVLTYISLFIVWYSER